MPDNTATSVSFALQVNLKTYLPRKLCLQVGNFIFTTFQSVKWKEVGKK